MSRYHVRRARLAAVPMTLALGLSAFALGTSVEACKKPPTDPAVQSIDKPVRLY